MRFALDKCGGDFAYKAICPHCDIVLRSDGESSITYKRVEQCYQVLNKL